ncbi:MAG: DNA translocase FtsK [Odoribacteraceae bacterium]|jgi:S-DNA-T family DNA segregation ATPase FtsK/SpoIIIE|nr:DNA translocase FtsK [Odoribacteraceae bacterium]
MIQKIKPVKSQKTGRYKMDVRLRFALGSLLLLFSVYMFVAMVAFFFDGGMDQSVVDTATGKVKGGAENSTGVWGAMLANRLINLSFGVPSFIFCYLLALAGLRLFNRPVKRFAARMVTGLVMVVWASLFLGYASHFFPSGYLFPGGTHGYFVSEWLNVQMGEVGTFFLLVFTLVVIVMFGFNGFFRRCVAAFKARIARSAERRASRRAARELKRWQERQSTEEEPEEPEVAPRKSPRVAVEEEASEVESPFLDDEVEVTVTTSRQEERVDANPQPEEDYDPTLDLSRYKAPPLDLLEEHSEDTPQVTPEELEMNKKTIIETLRNYKIEITRIKVTKGPTVTLYEIVPAPGVKIAWIKRLEDDIALSLAALGIRIIAPIPGAGTVGIEVPNLQPGIVSMRGILSSKRFQESKYALPVALGRTIANEPFTFDLTKMPHLLVAGATGQGKSVGLNAIITSLLYKKHPAQLKFVMIDPKKVELSIYSIIERHFLAKLPGEEDAIITETSKVITTLKSLCVEMDTRYDLLKKAQVRNVKEYNDKFVARHLNPLEGHRFLPYIVVVVDEFGDLIMTAGKEVELPIARIAQLARAVGIHMIIATQRPSANIITGVIKANFPARIAFKVAAAVDSRVILDSTGANQLIGRGDMLISVANDVTRVQCAFVDTPEVERITRYIASQQGYPSAYELPEYHEDGEGNVVVESDPGGKDPLFDDAARLLVSTQQGSTSSIQRRFSIGYARAGRIMDQLSRAGIVGPFEGSKARQVLVQDEYSLERMLGSIGDQL